MAIAVQDIAFEKIGNGGDAAGNYGPKGQAPVGNLGGGPPVNWRGEPQGLADNPYAQAYVNGVVGTRIFWVYSPSIFSGATGGSSGYYHICAGNRFYSSAEGATNLGGGSGDAGWVGVAGTSEYAGSWSVQRSPNGPLLTFSGSGGSNQLLLTTLLQGRFVDGRTQYAVEAGQATCP